MPGVSIREPGGSGSDVVGDGPQALIASMLDVADAGRSGVGLVTGARGTGKTRVADIARALAAERAFTVMSCHGDADSGPYEGVQDLIGPLIEMLDTLVPGHARELRQLCSGRLHSADPGIVRAGVLHLVTQLGEASPLCIVIDDVHLLDPESESIFAFLLRRLPERGVAVIATAARRLDWPRAQLITLDPLTDECVSAVLHQRGLAAAPARACARESRGVPGMAIALADGLTPGQRSGHERLPMLLSPGRPMLDHHQDALSTLDPSTQRALVVVAADELGHLGAIRAALAGLGENPEALDDAELRGLIEIDGPTVRFIDPWWRPAAYYLVAPASRRAAHRALAESYGEPHQAAARAWQLAAAADGPCDRVAAALALVAADSARRGHTAQAVDTYSRAADFALTGDHRQHLLLDALQTAVDGLEIGLARELAGRIEPTSPDIVIAIADTMELAGVSIGVAIERSSGGDDAALDGWWAKRRHDRLQRQQSARGGRLDEFSLCTDAVHLAHALLADAQLHRHAGRIADSRAALCRLEAMLKPSCTELLGAANVLHADLDHLAGRFDEAEARLRRVGRVSDVWTRQMADLVRIRLDGATVDSVGPPWCARLGIDVATEPLATVRSLIAAGRADLDLDMLDRAASQALDLGLSIEAAEARLAALEVAVSIGPCPSIADRQRVAAGLWRLGVHAWDRRLAALDEMGRTESDPRLARLSQAEIRVAEAVSAGMTNREAAAALYISVKTVDFHLQQIYRKLEVRSRTELAVMILGDGRAQRRAG
ncbi:MAG: regulatory protein LuxR [Ilumatobacteraceae bacterium]|nr:regulatory protein LuxR [Ilumatobacteraceae bacterium]